MTKVKGSFVKQLISGSITKQAISGSIATGGLYPWWDTRYPYSLSATALGPTSIKLDWTDEGGSGWHGVCIERGDDAIYFTEIARIAPNTTYTDSTGLTLLGTYYYRIRYYRDSSYSEYSGIDVATTIFGNELDLYTSGLTTELSIGYLTLLNTFITAVKSGMSITNLSDAFDIMYILANETTEAALRNLVKRLHDATAYNTPTFTALEGYTGNGSSMYIDTNYNANTQGSRYTLDSASMGYYGRLNVTTGTPFGVFDNGGTTFSIINGRNSSNQFQVRLNTAGAGVIGTNYVTGAGLYIGSRTASNVTNGYTNGVVGTTKTDLSVSMYNYTHYILAAHRSVGATQYSTQQVSFAFAGRGLVQAEVTVIKNAFEAFMDANGKGIIA